MISISIVIPVYNTERYVCQCVDSILKQSFQDFEIIIIDDASTDASYEIVKQKYSKLEKVKILQNASNLRQGLTRNIGMKAAKGKYLYFMDSDDVLLPKGLEHLYTEAEKHRADIMHMSEWWEPAEENFAEKGEIKVFNRRDAGFRPGVYRLPLEAEDRIKVSYGTQRNGVMVWLNLYRRDFLVEKKIEFPDMMHEDNAFAMACYAATNRIYCCSGLYYLYRQRSTSTEHDKSFDRLEKELKTLVTGIKYVEKSLSAYVGTETVRYGQLFLFREMWANVLPYYGDGRNIPERTVKTVEKIMKEFFGNDYAFVSILMHFAGCSSSRLRLANTRDSVTLKKSSV